MTDEQRVRLVRQILEQLMKGELDEAEALTAIDHVKNGPHPHEYAAPGVRLRVTRGGGGLSSAARTGAADADQSIVTDEFSTNGEECWNGRPRRAVTVQIVEP